MSARDQREKRADALVGHEQAVQRFLPFALEDKVVPLRNDVRNRATGVRLAEGYAAVHASRRLVLELTVVESGRELVPVLDSLTRVAVVLHASEPIPC